MNTNEHIKRVLDYVNQFLDLILLSKQFKFNLKLPYQGCKERLLTLEQPKTFLFFPKSQSVKLIQQINYSQFEISVQRYGRGLVYNTAKAKGTIVPSDSDPETITIEGSLELGKIFLVFYVGFLASLIIFVSASWWVNDLGFILLIYAVNFLYMASAFRDYRKLNALIHDTFSYRDKIVSEHK